MALPQSTATAPSAPEVAPVESAGRATPEATGPAKNGTPARADAVGGRIFAVG